MSARFALVFLAGYVVGWDACARVTRRVMIVSPR